MTPLSETDIAARVAAVARLGDPRGSGLMFHGTAEPFDGPLRVTGADGVLWFADDPLVAQTYICEAGLTSVVGLPSDWRLDERVRPDRHDFWPQFAVETMKRTAPEAEYDDFGMARSWTIPAGWPTYRDCVAALRRLGYAFLDGYDRIKHAEGPDGAVAPAAWLQPGRCFVTAAEGLRLLDLSTGESDLQEKAHLDFATFRAAEAQSYDGIVIDDFCQSADYGNVGHRSVGLFPHAVDRLETLSYEAVHRRFGGARGLLTPDFVAFAAPLTGPASARPLALSA